MLRFLMYHIVGLWYRRNMSPPDWILSLYLRSHGITEKTIEESKARIIGLINELLANSSDPSE